ncbi:hypothetical protein ACE6H2_006620 [Prunus campanulata]
MGKKKSRNKSLTRANPSSAQGGPSSSAQRDPHTAVSATSTERTWASLLKPKQQTDPVPLGQQGSSSLTQTAAAYVAYLANTPAPQIYVERRCRLKEFLKNYYQWERGCQIMLRSLIRKVYHLELKGITRGPLNGENIFVIGNKAENLKVEILDTPHEFNPGMPCYRQQFLSLASEVVHPWKATRPSAWKHFLDMIKKHMHRSDFKQLEWHPLLLSTREQAKLITHAYIHLEIECKGWKKDYRTVTKPRDVDIGKTVGNSFGFNDVYKFRAKFQVIYEPNSLGALVFYRHAHEHVNDYIEDNQRMNEVEPKQIKDALLTPEQIENELARLFPEVALELFNFMLIKGIDIEKAI